MYEKQFIGEAATRSATTGVDRRRLFTMLGIAGAGAATATVLGGAAADAATSAAAASVDDPTVLNFALNLEYLEAEFYLLATTGKGLSGSEIDGKGSTGGVTGGKQVNFATKEVRLIAEDIASDERAHVDFLRSALGKYAVARPKINFTDAFNAAAKAAGVADTFDPFASEENFLLGAFLFEDVGVTAYKGAAGLIKNKTYLDAAAGILSIEAYHAGAIRTLLRGKGLYSPAGKISDARDSLDGSSNKDQGIGSGSFARITPRDKNAIAFGRTPQQVLDVVYLNPKGTKGGFFPNGLNGAVK